MHTVTIENAMLAILEREPGIPVPALASRCSTTGGRAYPMRILRRLERQGRIVRTKMPGAPHVGCCWLSKDVPDGARLWNQRRLEGL